MKDTVLEAPNEQIQSLSHPDMLGLVLEVNDPQRLRHIAGLRFAVEAGMTNDDDQEPFISWPPINLGFQPWLPLLLAKVARAELVPHLNGQAPMLVAIPRSATPYMHPILEYGIFPGAGAQWVLKPDQLTLYGVSGANFISLDVPSYVHGRDPTTGARRTEEVLFFHPERYEGQTVLLFDDAIAEGLSIVTVAQFLKTTLRAQRVLVASPMAKIVQGGEAYISQTGFVDDMSILVHVTRTHGLGGPIEFYATNV